MPRRTIPPLQPLVLLAIRQFVELIASHYAIEGVILYGSRARRTHRPDSDTDVAILMQGPHQPFLQTKLAMADAAYDVLLETGINISPLPVWMDEWEHPETYPNPQLLKNIAAEGIRL
jgi:predicted nucleotidyltransferase